MMKALIVAAGYGTRFFPVTKTVPKEMLPLVDRPAISFIIEELYHSGVREVLVISSRRKKCLEDYFDREIELEQVLGIKGEQSKLEKLKEEYIDNMSFHFVRQKEMRGTAHAIYMARHFMADDPFVVVYPDDIFISDPPLSKSLIEVHKKTGKNVLTGVEIPKEKISRFGIIDIGREIETDVYEVNDLIEKPRAGKAPSNFAAMGRYLFTPDFFTAVEPKLAPGIHEIYQTDGIVELAQENKVVFFNYKGEFYDTGEPLAYLKTITRYGLKNSEFANEYREFLVNLVKEFEN
ncbi:MAG: UTP--glucose-1-phosphate uridylyltransferase [Candidatus Odinarchaeota archaeon]